MLSNTNERAIDISKQFVGKINEKFTNVSQCEILSLSEVKYASRFVTSDKVLSFKRKLSGDNNLVEYGKRVNTYVDYQLTVKQDQVVLYLKVHSGLMKRRNRFR